MFKNLKDIIEKQVGSRSKKSASTDATRVDSFDFIELIQNWELIVGPMVYKHTRPLKLLKRKLVIVSNHPAFSHQLSFLKDDILKKTKAHFPKLQSLTDIQFETNAQMFQKQAEIASKTIKKPEPKIHPMSPQYLELKKQAIKIVEEHYGAEEFKEVLIEIYLDILLRENT